MTRSRWMTGKYKGNGLSLMSSLTRSEYCYERPGSNSLTQSTERQ